MKLFSGRNAALIGVSLILTVISPVPMASAMQVDDVGATESVSPLEPASADLQAFATSFDVTVEEAARRMTLQDELRTILFSELDSGFVETRTDFVSGFSFEYLTTSANPERAMEALEARGLAAYATVVRVPRSMESLLRAMTTVSLNRDEFRADLSLDTYAGRVVANVTNLPTSSRREEIARQAGAPIEWRRVDSLSVGYVGGGRPFDNFGCTGGFVVERTTTLVRGLSTAAHCMEGRSVFTYQNVNLSPQSFTKQGKADLGWLTSPALTWEPKVYMGQDGGGIRDVDVKTPRADIMIGDFMCKYGKATAYTCGNVTSKTECPDTIPNCANTWLRIDKTSNYAVMANQGDSGGPVMTSTAAKAIVQGGPNVSQPSWMYAMAVSLFDDELGIRVITTQ